MTMETGEQSPRKLRVAFDIGGVLSKYPEYFKPFIQALVASGTVEVFVVTDMHDPTDTKRMLRDNGFIGANMIPEENVHNSDYKCHGELCKAVTLSDLEIDIFFDDFPAYLLYGCPVRLSVCPDPFRPYFHDDWAHLGNEGGFGRRVVSSAQRIFGEKWKIWLESRSKKVTRPKQSFWTGFFRPWF